MNKCEQKEKENGNNKKNKRIKNIDFDYIGACFQPVLRGCEK